MGYATIGTKSPYQALGDHPKQGGADQEGFHPHLVEPGKGAHGVVAVEGGEHEVAGEGRLDGRAGGFQVARFTHQQHIGVLAHEGPQGGAEVEALVPVHLGLGDSLEGVFDRIFHRGDVDRRVVPLRQQGVERGGFARSGRTGHQNHAEGFAADVAHASPGQGVGDQGVESKLGGAAVQQPEHDLLAVAAGQGAHPEIHGAASKPSPDPSVLGQPAFGDIQVSHDLQP